MFFFKKFVFGLSVQFGNCCYWCTVYLSSLFDSLALNISHAVCNNTDIVQVITMLSGVNTLMNNATADTIATTLITATSQDARGRKKGGVNTDLRPRWHSHGKLREHVTSYARATQRSAQILEKKNLQNLEFLSAITSSNSCAFFVLFRAPITRWSSTNHEPFLI